MCKLHAEPHQYLKHQPQLNVTLDRLPQTEQLPALNPRKESSPLSNTITNCPKKKQHDVVTMPSASHCSRPHNYSEQTILRPVTRELTQLILALGHLAELRKMHKPMFCKGDILDYHLSSVSLTSLIYLT